MPCLIFADCKVLLPCFLTPEPSHVNRVAVILRRQRAARRPDARALALGGTQEGEARPASLHAALPSPAHPILSATRQAASLGDAKERLHAFFSLAAPYRAVPLRLPTPHPPHSTPPTATWMFRWQAYRRPAAPDRTPRLHRPSQARPAFPPPSAAGRSNDPAPSARRPP